MKKFVHALNYLKTFKTSPRSNLRMQSPQQNKKAVLTKPVYFKVSDSYNVPDTIIVLCLTSFTQNGVSTIKEKK